MSALAMEGKEGIDVMRTRKAGSPSPPARTSVWRFPPDKGERLTAAMSIRAVRRRRGLLADLGSAAVELVHESSIGGRPGRSDVSRCFLKHGARLRHLDERGR